MSDSGIQLTVQKSWLWEKRCCKIEFRLRADNGASADFVVGAFKEV